MREIYRTLESISAAAAASPSTSASAPAATHASGEPDPADMVARESNVG